MTGARVTRTARKTTEGRTAQLGHSHSGELFRVDAKASGDMVTVAGWEAAVPGDGGAPPEKIGEVFGPCFW